MRKLSSSNWQNTSIRLCFAALLVISLDPVGLLIHAAIAKPASAKSYIYEEDGVYYYAAALTKEQKKSGRVAGDAVGYRYYGINNTGEYTLFNPSKDEIVYCKMPCKVIRLQNGDRILNENGLLVSLPFRDAFRGYLRDTNPNSKVATLGYFKLGAKYAKGQGVPQDDALAAGWYRKAAENGLAEAQFELGIAYGQGKGVPQDAALAASWLRKAADQGFGKAQLFLGAIYALGRGVPQDYAVSAIWYRKAANQGNPEAQLNLGVAYALGEGLPQDDALAIDWYRKAADQGNTSAQMNLGRAYALSKGVPQDYAVSAIWYRKAANQENPEAQLRLGIAYALGRGVPQDYAVSASWYRKAADQGNPEAQLRLGHSFYTGRGVPQDIVQSYKWLRLSSAAATDAALKAKAIKDLDEAETNMTPAQIREAQYLVGEWKPSTPSMQTPAGKPVSGH